MADVDGVRTFYVKSGSGQPVVLMHGAAPGVCSLIAWHLNIQPLAEAGLALRAVRAGADYATLYHQVLVTPELVQARYEMSRRTLFAARQRRSAAPPPRPIYEELSRLHQKTLIVWGTDDRGAAVARALPLLQALPDAELHVFARCGHWAQWDQASRFNGLIADFLLADAAV